MGIFSRKHACLVVVVLSFVTTCMVVVQAIGDDGQSMVVAPGQIPTGGALRSRHGRYLLAMQYDCNLVLYDLEKNRLPLWATNTSGHGANCYAAMQSNGNFVLYDGAHLIKFQTFTFIFSCTGSYLAWLQDDGNFVVYCAPLLGDLQQQQLSALWATGTDGCCCSRHCQVASKGSSHSKDPILMSLPWKQAASHAV